jgi:hypothetical protein
MTHSLAPCRPSNRGACPEPRRRVHSRRFAGTRILSFPLSRLLRVCRAVACDAAVLLFSPPEIDPPIYAKNQYFAPLPTLPLTPPKGQKPRETKNGTYSRTNIRKMLIIRHLRTRYLLNMPSRRLTQSHLFSRKRLSAPFFRPSAFLPFPDICQASKPPVN